MNRESVVSSGDFECFKAPLASMEDLSIINTPMSTPTAGQSPRMRSRWSHRSSSGANLELVLGPINEEDHEGGDREEESPSPPALPPKMIKVRPRHLEIEPLRDVVLKNNFEKMRMVPEPPPPVAIGNDNYMTSGSNLYGDNSNFSDPLIPWQTLGQQPGFQVVNSSTPLMSGSDQWRRRPLYDVIMEDENMQLQHNSLYDYPHNRFGPESTFLKPRQIRNGHQPPHAFRPTPPPRVSSRNSNATDVSSGRASRAGTGSLLRFDGRRVVAPSDLDSSLLRANDGRFQAAKSQKIPKDRYNTKLIRL